MPMPKRILSNPARMAQVSERPADGFLSRGREGGPEAALYSMLPTY